MKPKGGPRGPPRPKRDRSTTPRGAEAARASNMTPEEKAKTPCMFFAYNMCKAKSCAVSIPKTQKYQGPPPRVLAKDGPKGRAPAKVAASSMADFKSPKPWARRNSSFSEKRDFLCQKFLENVPADSQ